MRTGSAALAATLSRELNLHPVLSTVLSARGITDVAAARRFLSPDLTTLPDPFLLSGMTAAVERLLQAAQQGEQVLVYGDYDVDGISGIIILQHALTALGARVTHYIPNRLDDGYGVHEEVLRRAARQGVTLVVTVDTGIAAFEAAVAAQSLNLDLIITDHHSVPTQLPPALAIVHPQLGAAYPNPHLSGAGVALKVVQALAAAAGQPADFWLQALDLAAIATIADVMPLTGENRVIVAGGLSRLQRQPRPGVAALLKKARLSAAEVTSWHVSFQIAPRLNSPGRLHGADLAARLLLADGEEAGNLADLLETQNNMRRTLQEKIAAAVEEQVGPQGVPRRPLLMGDAAWHRGVLGVVAGRLARQWDVPVLLAREEDGVWRGSARSVPGFNLIAALEEAAPLLEEYGGHAQAAGFTVKIEKVPRLTAALARAFAAKAETAGHPQPMADALVEAADVNTELALALQQLEPCGAGNPPPLLASRLPVAAAHCIGRHNDHLRLTFHGGTEAIAFGQGHLLGPVRSAGKVAALFTPGFNTWRGRRRLQLRIEELEPYREQVRLTNGSPTTSRTRPLNRDLLAGLYRFLRRLAEPAGAFTAQRLNQSLQQLEHPPDEETVALGLQVFVELELLAPPSDPREDWVLLAQPDTKVELSASPTYRRRATEG